MSLHLESELPRLLAFATVSLLDRRRARDAVRAALSTRCGHRPPSRIALYRDLALLCAHRLDGGRPDADLVHVDSALEVTPRRRGETVLWACCGFGTAEAAHIARALPDVAQDLAA